MPGSFSLAQAHLYRALADARNLQMISSTQFDQDHYALVLAGQWFGRQQMRCYLVSRAAGQWQVLQLPNDWITSTARTLQPQPALPDGQEN